MSDGPNNEIFSAVSVYYALSSENNCSHKSGITVSKKYSIHIRSRYFDSNGNNAFYVILKRTSVACVGVAYNKLERLYKHIHSSSVSWLYDYEYQCKLTIMICWKTSAIEKYFAAYSQYLLCVF